METVTYNLPAYWASALINDDASGLSDQDVIDMDQWLDRVKPGYCIGCTEYPEIGTFKGILTDLLTFTFHTV